MTDERMCATCGEPFTLSPSEEVGLRRHVEGKGASYAPPSLYFPFAGLPLGKAMQATKRAASQGTLGFL